MRSLCAARERSAPGGRERRRGHSVRQLLVGGSTRWQKGTRRNASTSSRTLGHDIGSHHMYNALCRYIYARVDLEIQ